MTTWEPSLYNNIPPIHFTAQNIWLNPLEIEFLYSCTHSMQHIVRITIPVWHHKLPFREFSRKSRKYGSNLCGGAEILHKIE